MDKTNGMLTVFFDEPFWVGVFERSEDDKLSAAKVTFGAEPKDSEVWDYVLRHYYKLKFSPAVKAKTKQTADNPNGGSAMHESSSVSQVSAQSRSKC